MRKFVRNLYARYVPAPLQERIAVYAKAFVGASVQILQIVNLTVPDYSDEARAGVGAILLALTYLGIAKTRNARKAQAADDVARRRRAARA